MKSHNQNRFSNTVTNHNQVYTNDLFNIETMKFIYISSLKSKIGLISFVCQKDKWKNISFQLLFVKK